MHNAKTHRVLTITVNPAGRIVGVGITRPRTAITAQREASRDPVVCLPADHANEALRGCVRRKLMVRAERFPRNYDCLDLLGRDAVDVAGDAVKRRWTDAPAHDRCRRTITLRDGSTAQCGRRRAKGYSECTQHARMTADAALKRGRP